jgi:hypothetical protein
MNKLSTCDAVRLIQKSTILRVNGDDAESWTTFPKNMDALDNDEVVLSIRQYDEKCVWIYEFTVGRLLAANVVDNCITAIDTDGNEVTINCYHCVPVTLD